MLDNYYSKKLILCVILDLLNIQIDDTFILQSDIIIIYFLEIIDKIDK
jgi:hypothetical protein